MSDESRVVELAAAVLDGTAIDWTSEQSSSDAAPSSLLNHLQVVAAIADLHRSAADALDSRSVPRVHPGGQWGHLRLLECIARGAFGEVYRAWDTRLDREVALKLLPAAGVSTDRGASSIIHEGRLLARVRHPNVVTIYGAEQIDDRIGLWMEYVRGRTLEQIVKQGATFTAIETARIGAEICKAISAVHAAGLLHRDIKAQNVMLADDGRVVLMDFGAGREFDDGAATDLAGTPLYLAPEVFRGQRATAQSDIYSLGVLLFHLVSRGYPVHARTTADLRLAHERGDRTPLRATRGEVPAALVRVIDRALHPVPTLRYGTADELGRELVALNRRSRTLPAFYAGVALATALLVVSVPLARPGRLPSPRIAQAGTHPAIAVLPFKNLSAGAGNEEFADGLTYEIHRNLAGIHGLELRSSTSSFSFRGARRLSDIREQLGADYLLEGSILSSSRTIRVHVRFARVADDTTVWAAKYDRSRRDIFAIQDEISLEIVNALRLKVGRGQRRYEIDPDLYYQFLKARGLRSRRDPENAARAAALFEAIVARDPAFAPAWSGLASALADATRHQPREEIPLLDPRMEPAALNAIRIDPLLAEAHAAMGSVYGRNRDWANARKSFETALELNPSLTTTYTDFVLSTLLPMGRNIESVQRLETARRVDPLSLDVPRLLAHVLVNVGRHADAIENARWVLARDPKFPYAEVFLGRALLFAGRPKEALVMFENSQSEGDWGYIGYLYAVTGRGAEAEALAASHPDAAARQMLIYGGLGDKNRAFEALERTAQVNWWRAATWMIRPEMSVLRGDPRVHELRDRLGLPPFEEPQ